MLRNTRHLDNSFSIAALWGTSSEYRPYNGGIELTKNDEKMVITRKLFENEFHILDDSNTCALKDDCAFFRISNNGVTLINSMGMERVVSFQEFRNSYRF